LRGAHSLQSEALVRSAVPHTEPFKLLQSLKEEVNEEEINEEEVNEEVDPWRTRATLFRTRTVSVRSCLGGYLFSARPKHGASPLLSRRPRTLERIHRTIRIFSHPPTHPVTPTGARMNAPQILSFRPKPERQRRRSGGTCFFPASSTKAAFGGWPTFAGRTINEDAPPLLLLQRWAAMQQRARGL